MPEEIKSGPAVVEPMTKSQTPGCTPVRHLLWPIVRFYRIVRGILALGMLSLVVLLVTPIPERIYTWLDVTAPAENADYIVCLGGNPSRLLWAVEAYRKGYAPRIIVTSLPSAAQWMQRKLVQCGIPESDILVDDQSKTTGDHPACIAALPNVDPALQKFLVVTDYEHSRRAAACFRQGGYQHVTMFGAGFTLREEPESKMRWRWRVMELPRLAYECSALVKYWVQGRI
jgi:uncharacterized SAM-binding protein YcdF (DUF218 family)